MLTGWNVTRLARRKLLGGLAATGAVLVAVACGRQLVPGSAAPQRAASQAEPSGPPAAPELLIGVIFGRVLLLEGVSFGRETVRAGDDLQFWLHWQSVAPSQEDLRSIGRVVTAGGRVVASEDDQIGGRRRHLSRWAVGERRIDEMRLRIAPGTPRGEHALTIGVLRPDNLTPVPVTTRSANVATWQEDAVLVRTIEVVAG